jgi:O-antigen ligase
MVFLMSALFLTKSVSAIVAVLAGSGVFVAFRSVSFTRAWRMIAVPIALAALLSIGYLSVCWSAYSVGEVHNSLASRVMIWNASREMIIDSPIVGIGSGNFQEAYLRYQQRFPQYLEWAVPHPHNILLALWLNTGIFGLIGFLIVSYVAVREAVRTLQKGRPAFGNALPALVLSFFAAFFVNGMADTPYFKNDFSIFFWIFVVLSLMLRGFGGDFGKNWME